MPHKDPTARYEYQKARRAADPDKIRQSNKNRARKRWDLLEFRHVELPSEQIFEEMWSAAKISIFLQSSDKIALWCEERPRVLREELLLFGVAAVLRVLRRNCTAASVDALKVARATHNRQGIERLKATQARAKQFERIVEMLDSHSVGTKLLGDCTKGDLLRAAAEAESLAGEATMNAQFYRLLAGMLPEHGVTVRQANNRKEIVALLTTTFREAA